jgi:hypothetical protein
MVVPYKVYVVVDREFGEKLSKLAAGVPVWIVDTPLNTASAQRLRKERTLGDHLTGITTFKGSESLSAEDLLVSQLDAIDLHHGTYSASPPYTILEVLGVRLCDRIKAELSEFGFNEFDITATGFCAVRSLPSD